MLSILIPVYNFDIRSLVQRLWHLGHRLSIEWEIRCYDDGSAEAWKEKNREIMGLAGVYYQELPQNLGRSRIRNLLAEEAQGDYLLFLDCDSEVPHDAFLYRYAELLRPNTLLYGGRIYQAAPPADPALYFHWLYGSKREAIPAAERRAQPYRSFMTNNFLIPTAIFLQIRFDERLLQYGHEDTLFGMQLEKKGIRIQHLDNPLIHAGLEPVGVFLSKTRQGIQNLAFLYRSGYHIDTRLLRFYKQAERLKLTAILPWVLRVFRPIISRQLFSSKPSLRLFDLYKLSLLLDELQRK